MAKIIKDSYMEKIEHYSHVFHWADNAGAGFSFSCDKDGKINTSKMSDVGLKNLAMCQNCSDGTIIDDGIVDYSHEYRHGRTIQCDCGKVFEIDYDEQECEKCGQLYSLFGNKIAYRTSECYGFGDY